MRFVWASACALAVGCSGPPPAPTEPPPATVRVAPVEEREIAMSVPAVGTVVPVEVSRVAAGATGLVVDYPLREGALVEQEAPLAQLRTVTLELDVDAARATLRQKEQEFAQLKAGYRPQEIAQAKARVAATDAEMKYAEAHAKRIEDIFNTGNRAITETERDAAVFDAERTRQVHAEATADYEMKQAGYRAEEVEAAAAAVEAQRNAVYALEDELQKMTIRAPFTGYLVEKTIEVGEWVETGGTVGTLARLDEVEVRVNVEESHVHEVTPGETVDVQFDSLGGATIAGEVKYIVPRSQWVSGSRSFPVIVRVKNRIEQGRPVLNEGMVARVTFRGPPHKALVGHKDAVVRSSGRPMVFVVGSDRAVRAVEVVEGISQESFVELQGDLRAGDLLVTEGAERLRPFETVAILDETTTPGAAAEQGDAASAPAGG